MNKNRMEAFSDGVIAILITIMVFDIKPPVGTDFAALATILPLIFSYVMSFLYLGIYWNNHHHLLVIAPRITGAVLWANLHLLFWLSLFPFTTNWLRASEFQSVPVALYGVVLFCAAAAYLILQQTLIHAEGSNSKLKRFLGNDVKGKVSIVLYGIGIGTAFVSPRAANGLYMVVAVLWLIPDRRIESQFKSSSQE